MKEQKAGNNMAEGEIVAVGAPKADLERRGVRVAARLGAGENRRLVVVSNRVAVESGKPDSGGLAVAIRAALESSGGIWFGWSGEVSDEGGGDPALVARGPLTYATLDLSRRDYEEYYLGFANRVLWPLFHFRGSLVEYSRRDFAGYLRVNRGFARTLAPMLTGEDLVWVHDYHLIPLGRELRRLGLLPADRLFPAYARFRRAELLRVLPNHRDLVEALCAYDLVGFQTESDLHGFRDYLVRWAGAEDLGHGAVRAFGRIVRGAGVPDRHRHRRCRGRGGSRRRHPPDAPARAEPGRAHLDDRGRSARLFEGPAGAVPGLWPAARNLSRDARAHRLHADRAAIALRGSGISGDPPHAGHLGRPYQRPLRRIRLDAAALHQQELQPSKCCPGFSGRAGSAW